MNKVDEPRKEVKICDRCGYENEPDAIECMKCKSKRFAPPWVLKKRPINRQVSAEITRSNPEFGPVQKRISLSKWWPGGNANFHIPNIEQWNAIEKIVNEDLGPILEWNSAIEQVRHIRQHADADQEVEVEIRKLADNYPELFSKLVEALNPDKLAREDIDLFVVTLVQLTDAVTKGNASFREAFIAVLKKLPKQGQKALAQLETLLHNWSLQQITSVAQTVQSRLNTIELFKSLIQDERTFEIRGDHSIHRILEKAMWMIDERYWLLKSNSTLWTFIGDEMSKRDRRRFGKKRPDFVCGSVGQKLIIVELKRPSKTLTIKDLNQLETYLTITEEYTSEYKSYEAYLIGKKKDDDLMRRLKHRSSTFRVLTYTDLVDKTEQRYQEYLQGIES